MHLLLLYLFQPYGQVNITKLMYIMISIMIIAMDFLLDLFQPPVQAYVT